MRRPSSFRQGGSSGPGLPGPIFTRPGFPTNVDANYGILGIEAAAAGGTNTFWPAFVQCAPQIDARAMAGTAVMFFGALFGAHSNTAQGAEYTFGTHALAIHQSQNKVQVFPSVRTPPAAAASAVPAFVYVRPADPLAAPSVLWRSQPAAATVASPIASRVATEPQSNPAQVQPQIWEPTPAQQGRLGAQISVPQQLEIAPKQIIWPSAASAPIPTSGLLGTYSVTAPQYDLTPKQNIWQSATAVIAAGSADRKFTFILSAPQADPTQVQPIIWRPIPGLSTDAGQGAQYTFGLHQLAIAQSQNVSSVWPSVRTPPAAASTPIARWVASWPQVDTTPIQSVIWKPIPAEQGALIIGTDSEPQTVQVIQPQIFKSAPAPVTVTPDAVSKRVQTAPQFDPTQVQPQVWAAQVTVNYAVRTWITTAPQADPTQIQPVLFASQPAAPVISGPTIRQFVTPGQFDYNLPTVAVWTPATLFDNNPCHCVFPDPSDVRAGIVYGPTGIEYTGTLVVTTGGSSYMRRR